MKTPELPLAVALALKILAAGQTPTYDSIFAGEWRGDSVCAADAPSCHDEKVIYYIRTIPGKPDLMFVRADKVLDGKAITTAKGPVDYAASRSA